MLLFGVVSYKVRPPRLVSYACLYTTNINCTLILKKVPKSSQIVLSSLQFIPFPSGKHRCLHAKSRYKWGKVLSKGIASKVKIPTLAGSKQLFHPSLPS